MFSENVFVEPNKPYMVAILQFVHMHANGRVSSISRQWHGVLISIFQFLPINTITPHLVIFFYEIGQTSSPTWVATPGLEPTYTSNPLPSRSMLWWSNTWSAHYHQQNKNIRVPNYIPVTRWCNAQVIFKLILNTVIQPMSSTFPNTEGMVPNVPH